MTVAVFKERPFDGRVMVLPVAHRPTISEIAATVKDMPRGWLDNCECRVNGDLVPRECWDRVRPRVASGRDVVVTFTTPIHGGGGGGGGGGKNTIALVAIIAVILIAAAVTGGLLGPSGLAILGPAFAAGQIGATVAAAAITVAGGLAISALTRPPSLGGPALGEGGGDKTGVDTKQPAALNGNVLAKGAPIPRVLGTHRLFPPLLAPPLVEVIGDDEYAEAIFALAGPHAITSMKVGDSDITLMDDIETEVNEGLASSLAPTIITRQSFTDTTAAVQMSKHTVDNDNDTNGKNLLDQATPANSLPIWHAMASRVGPDEIWIPLAFSGGLLDTTATTASVFVPFRVRMREKGSSTWINLPELHVVRHKQSRFTQTVKLMFRTAATLVAPPTDGGFQRAYRSVGTQDEAPVGTGGWTADSYFNNGTGTVEYLISTNYNTTTKLRNVNLYGDRAEFYLDPATFLPGKTWDIQVMRGQPVEAADFTGATYNTNSALLDLFGYRTVPSSTITLVGQQENSAANGANVTVNIASLGLNQGDFVLVIGGHTQSGVNAGVSTSGYTEIVDISTASRPRLSASYKFMGPTPDTTVTCLGSGVVGDAAGYVVYGFRHVDTTTPIDVTSTTATGTGSPDGPAISNNIGGAIVTAVAALEDEANPTKPNTGFATALFVNQVGGTFDVTVAATWKTIVGTQVDDPGTWGNLGSPWSALTIALRAENAHRTEYDQQSFVDVVAIPRVSSIWNETPVPDPSRFATIAMRVKNRNVQDFSVLASGYTYDWDGVGWNTFTTTSNPAPHFYDVLTGTLGGDPMPAAVVDSDILVDWRQHNIDMGYEVNAVVEGKTYLDVLNLLASTGYARLTHSERWGVFMDKDRSAEDPIQIFTPRNMREFSWTRAFAKLPTGIRAKFNDSEDEYRPSETIVYVDSANPQLDKLEQISYDGLVTTAEIVARAAFDLLQLQKRMTFYEGTTDLEALVCTRGDLVGVQHDILMSQAGFARIKSITSSGGNLTGLVLDGTVPVLTESGIFSTAHLFTSASIFDLGAQTGLAIRHRDGSGVTVKSITAADDGDFSTITFVTPFADPGSDKIDIGCLCSVGRLGSEYKRLIVFAVVPKEDMTATVTFVDEAPELWE